MKDPDYNLVFDAIQLLQVTRWRPDLLKYEVYVDKKFQLIEEEVNIPFMVGAKNKKDFQELFYQQLRNEKGADEAFFRSELIHRITQSIEDLRLFKEKHHDLKEALNNYLQWLKSQDKPQEPEKTPDPERKFFKEDWHWDLIKRLIDVDGSQQEYNDYIFYYHAMKGKYSQSREKNDFILDGLRPIDYRNWIKRRFNLEVAFQWKTHHQVESDQRIRRFNDLVKLLDPKNQIINK